MNESTPPLQTTSRGRLVCGLTAPGSLIFFPLGILASGPLFLPRRWAQPCELLADVPLANRTRGLGIRFELSTPAPGHDWVSLFGCENPVGQSRQQASRPGNGTCSSSVCAEGVQYPSVSGVGIVVCLFAPTRSCTFTSQVNDRQALSGVVE